MSRLLACFTAITAFLALPQLGGAGDGAAPETGATYDCGTLALFTLLRLEGRPADLAKIEVHLPPPTPRGYSMRELRDAARARGLRLDGVRLRDGEPLDRPVLVFLRRGRHGHFLVLRPVGHAGTLVQAIDPGRGPEVRDAAALRKSPEWTGLALLPRRADWTSRGASILLVAMLALILFRALRFPRERFVRKTDELRHSLEPTISPSNHSSP